MADFLIAVDQTIEHEGGFFENHVTGEVVNFGITVWFLRDIGKLTGTGFPDADEIDFVRNMTHDYAVDLYRQYFWDEKNLGEVTLPQDVVDKLFDLGVNLGGGDTKDPGAFTIAQETVNLINPTAQLALDGILGPLSLAALNAVDPNIFLPRYKVLVAQRYAEIAARNPKLRDDLPGWLARLDS